MQKLYEVVRKKQLPDKVEAIGKLFIQQMAANENWQGMVKLFSDKAISQDTKEKLSETLAYTIAQSKEFRIADVDSKNQIANLLKQLFIDTKWKNIVPMRVAGAAFENAYKLVDTLEFYEGVWKKKRIPSSKRDTQYAIKRWVKTKMRLAEFLEKEGYSGFGKHREEAEAICNKRLGISKNSIPEEFECDFTRQTKAKEIDLSDDKRKAIILLHDGGMTNQQIKNSLGIDLNIIYEIINTRQNGEKGEII